VFPPPKQQQQLQCPHHHQQHHQHHQQHHHSPAQPLQSQQLNIPSVPRRQDKATPSYYSFASDSTKLGEVPMRKWNVPFDFAEMDRLNREAEANGWQQQQALQQQQQNEKGRSRLRRWFGRGGGEE
jgi:hypothetical protein